ncbi:unnamed protein product [Notodromas monacha]|uniref:SWIM-type domain-containing protein n=1 Tax=Notodromas monacha TaxID=399045 RepID=A0A7R9BXS0_9CRUS|nr:unnamed protein product [Notodromas monacha]CAG0922199.1 unnamed protein product [Notodromas monacha]
MNIICGRCEAGASQGNKKTGPRPPDSESGIDFTQAQSNVPAHLTSDAVTRVGCEGALDNVPEEDIQRIIDNPTLYTFYQACILGEDVRKIQCTCSGWELRRIMVGLVNPSLCPPRARHPYCPSSEQRIRGQDFMKHLSKVLLLLLVASLTAVDFTQAQSNVPAHLTSDAVTRVGCEGALDNVPEEDIQRIIDNPTLYTFYQACILGEDVRKIQCTCSGWELRRIMVGLVNPSLCPPRARHPYCPSSEQRIRGQDFMKHLSKVDNKTWRKVLSKYSGRENR